MNLTKTRISATGFVEQFGQHRASAILRTGEQDLARQAMNAAIRGGFRIIEFTLSIPGALELIAEFSAKPDLIVGAGTVLTVDEVDQVIAAGADFVVSPVIDVEVIQRAKFHGVACMPGTSTPTEMLQAHRAGAELQKLFPETATGPAWVKQTLGPLPFLKIVPTSGVTLANAADYLRAGAFAVGFVNSLFVPDEIKSRRFDLIEQRAQSMLAAVNF
jgi:2-dehydro-3-deoxyphosphogluconate aldolase / (4S)-4-hydroxy-2-oxoglutarate aldolase